MQLVNIGFGSLVAAERIVAVISPDSAPIKRMVQELRERRGLIDASFGRKTKSVIITDSGHILLSALPPESIAARTGNKVDITESGGGLSE